MGDFDGRIILVTGSATGLGAAIAVGAARRGAKAVLLNYSKSRKEAEATADVVRAAGAEVDIAQGDVADDPDSGGSTRPWPGAADLMPWLTMPASPSTCTTTLIWRD